jgi:hypothetical protein
MRRLNELSRNFSNLIWITIQVNVGILKSRWRHKVQVVNCGISGSTMMTSGHPLDERLQQRPQLISDVPNQLEEI